jgi:hypothetical protein
MLHWLKPAAALSLSLAFIVAPAAAQDTPGATLRRHAEAGTLAAGEGELARRAVAEPASAEAATALGMARFALAVERFGRSMHRHGLRVDGGVGLGLPGLRMPVPANPQPQPLGYEAMRAIWARFAADLGGAREALGRLPGGEFHIRLDLSAIRLDLDGDGRGSEAESLGAMVVALAQGPGQRRRGEPVAALPPWPVAFDRADAIWLNGYATLLTAFVEAVLAHDWREAFLATGHLFFPEIEGGSPVARLSRPGPDMAGDSGAAIADAIAFIHLARFPVVEPARLAEARRLLVEVVRLSRANWDAILAETDDEAEWLPAPRQRNSAVQAMDVTEERVGAWRAVLDDLEAVLEGRALLAHWRFEQGVDLRRAFEEPRTFDLVGWVAGYAAAPYLRAGPTVSGATLAQWQRAFGGNFLGFAAWFN